MKIFVALVCFLSLSACSDKEVFAEVLINRATPPELYRTHLVELDEAAIVGLIESDCFWEKVADANLNESRDSVRLKYFAEKRIIKVSGSNSEFVNHVAETITLALNQLDQNRRNVLTQVLEDSEVAHSDSLQDARKKYALFVSPKVLVSPPTERTGIDKMLFEQTAELMLKEIDRKQESVDQLHADHQSLKTLLKISYELAVIGRRAR